MHAAKIPKELIQSFGNSPENTLMHPWLQTFDLSKYSIADTLACCLSRTTMYVRSCCLEVKHSSHGCHLSRID